MFETLLEHFQGSALSLWGPFLVLLLCGLGLPIPEDIVLLTAGALAQIDGRSWMVVSGIMYAGVIGGDSITFLAGRHLGGRVLTSAWFRRLASPQKQAKVEDFFERHGTTGLFIARFLPGLRAPIFFTAGSMKVSFLKFLWLDGLAALISVRCLCGWGTGCGNGFTPMSPNCTAPWSARSPTPCGARCWSSPSSCWRSCSGAGGGSRPEPD